MDAARIRRGLSSVLFPGKGPHFHLDAPRVTPGERHGAASPLHVSGWVSPPAGRRVRCLEILIDGEPAGINSPTDACGLGVALVTEDRKARGLILASTVRDNLALPSVGALSRFSIRDFAREAALAEGAVERLSVRCSDIEQIVSTLSGGNQQKIVIGKWLATEPRVLLLDEPTRGIDVGAKQEIYELVFALASRGLGIVVVSSEMPELLLELFSEEIPARMQARAAEDLSRHCSSSSARWVLSTTR